MKKNFNYFRFIAMPAVFAVLAIMFLLNLTSCKKDTGEAGADVSAQKIVLRKDTLYMVKGGTFTLRYDIEPETEDEPNVKWTSSDTDVADVNKNGKVTAKNKVGKATITVSTTDGKMKDKCIVIVSAEVSGVILEPKSSEIFINEELTLTAKVSPSDADQSVEWSSSDTKIATVDANGKVKGVKDGDVTITATSKVNTSKKSTCKVKVKPYGVSLNITEKEMRVNDVLELVAKVKPEGQAIEWSSSNTSVATVNNGKVTAKAMGTATITAAFKSDKSKKAECKITVFNVEIKLDKSEYVTIRDETIDLTATVTTNHADKSVTWSSSDESVATVTQDGTVTTIKEGVAKITATSNADNTKQAYCDVTVIMLSGGMSDSYKTIYEGESFELYAYIHSPKNYTDKVNELKWSSDNPSIAIVNNNNNVGKVCIVKGKGAGKTTIRAEYKSVTVATCVVTVKEVIYVGNAYRWDISSAREAPTYGEMQMYLGAGVYWDEEGPAWTWMSGDIYTTGLWVMKNQYITGFNNNSAKKVTVANDTNKLFSLGKPKMGIDKYFFLPAAGYWREADRPCYEGEGGYGRYWSFSSLPDDEAYYYALGFSKSGAELSAYRGNGFRFYFFKFQ